MVVAFYMYLVDSSQNNIRGGLTGATYMHTCYSQTLVAVTIATNFTTPNPVRAGSDGGSLVC